LHRPRPTQSIGWDSICDRQTLHVSRKHISPTASTSHCTYKPPLSSGINYIVNSVLQIDEFASMSISTAAAPITQNGEPVQVVLAGDPLQLEPRPMSKISDRLSGRMSLLDLLAKSSTYFHEMNAREGSVQRELILSTLYSYFI
jgi:hypothetical protein